MPIETSSTAAYAWNIGAVGVVGSFLGMPVDALILGALAGAIAHGLNKNVTRPNGISTLITSTLLAGAFSPVLVAWVSAWVDLGEPAHEAMLLKPLAPVLIGAAWPFLLPLLADAAKNLFAGWVRKFGGNRDV